MKKKLLFALTCAVAFAGLSGCGLPETSSGILDDLQKELKTPIRYTKDINSDPCLYKTLARLWSQYYMLNSEKAAEFRFRFIDRVDTLEVQPSKRIVRYTGKANFLFCQLGYYVSPDGDMDEPWVTSRVCGVREVDASYTADGENRPTKILVGKGKHRSVQVEYADFQGDFKTYVVRNLQREFKDFRSVGDELFIKYLNTPSGEMFNPHQPFIRERRPLTGALCASVDSISLEDLIRD
jgi:hypothetical protein